MKEYLALLVVALLVFGCTGGSESTSAKEVSPAGYNQEANKEMIEPEEQTPAPDNGGDITSKTISEIMGLGVPVVCDITIDNEFGKLDATLYMKGESFRQDAVITNDEGTQKVTVVYSNKKYYTSVPEEYKSQMAGCEWLEVDVPEGNGASQATSVEGIKNLPETSYSCGPGVFGDEKFEVSGKTCTMQDIMSMQMG